MRIVMIGAGYVGLVSAACFAEFGFHVTAVDLDAAKIERLNRAEIPIYEPGLEALVARNLEAGRLTFTTELPGAVSLADVVFIAVGTPSRRGDGQADLTHVYAAAEQIAPYLRGHPVVVTKSTVPVGTGAEVRKRIAGVRPDLPFSVASNPEFLREGSAIEDFLRPDRIVVGVEDDHAREVMSRLYRPLFLHETPMVFTDIATAELAKYAANAFLATKVAFINEMADICEQVGANVQDVARAMGLDRRIGSKFLHPGPGFGGSCFPKDTRALTAIATQAGAPSAIVEAVVASNEARKTRMAEKILHAVGDGDTVALLGLTFKPHTDDMRESASLTIVPALQAAGKRLRLYDPKGMQEARPLLGEEGIIWCQDAYDAVEGADAAVILTEWNEFRSLDMGRLKTLLRQPLLVDLRNIYRPSEVEAAGLRYVSVGR
jgi:UDPglucose 6-dehydrogenase